MPKAIEMTETNEVAHRIAETLDTDVLIYNGTLERPQDTYLIDACGSRATRSKVLLVLVTEGGDPNCAYRIARCLQNYYESFTVYVHGYCKSAGTLLALGADEIVISEHGELGPLDVQDVRKDDLTDTQSVLTVKNAISEIREEAFTAFESYFLKTMDARPGRISLQTAANIASSLVTGLFSPLLAKLDPLYVGDIARAREIAQDYGERLLECSRNMNDQNLKRLVGEYNSHGFVIDPAEAAKLFFRVRSPTPDELDLADSLGYDSLWPMTDYIDEDRKFRFLSNETQQSNDDEMHNNQGTPIHNRTR